MKYSNIDFTNDVKVLGRVVSIAMDNKIAEAEQVFDTPFKYNDQLTVAVDENKTGLSQYEINRLFRNKIYALDEAGLIPDGNTNSIPEIIALIGKFNEIEVANNATIHGNLVVDHKISANDIECFNLNVKTKATIQNLDVNGFAKFDKKVTFNQGMDVHGDSKFFNNVTIDGTLDLAGIGDVKTYLLNIKNDIGTQNPLNPSDYYTKEEIDLMFSSITNNYYDKTDIDGKLLWKRNGTTLSPKTDGDDVSTSGKVYSGN